MKLDPDDRALLRCLDDAMSEPDQVPAFIREAGYAAYAWLTVDAELAELHTLGPTHDLREASGDYLGDVAHWWPADGDSGTTVTDRGLVGGCNLTLNGNVTIGAV